MSVAKEAIEEKICDLMLAASSLTALQLVCRGMPFLVPQQYYPFAEVLIEEEGPGTEFTGGLKERIYLGTISISARVQDSLTVVNRKAVIASYVTVQNLVDATVELLSTLANHSLGGLTFTNGAVTQFLIGDEAIEYGIGKRDQRDNNFDNQGSVPFICTTQERIT